MIIMNYPPKKLKYKKDNLNNNILRFRVELEPGDTGGRDPRINVTLREDIGEYTCTIQFKQ